MDPLRLLESIEEFLYRTALWVLLLPRTVLRIVMGPGRIFSYVRAELAKKTEERFKDLLSPVLFWALAALIPHIMLLDLLAKLPDSRVAKEVEWQAFMAAPWSTRVVLVAVVALAGPLAFARGSLRDQRIQVDRDTLRLPLFVQCYCFTPAYLALLPIVYYELRYDAVPDRASMFVFATSWFIFTAWLAIAESAALSEQLGVSRLRAGLKAGRYFVSAVVLLFLLELFVITLYQGLSLWATI